MQTVSAALLSKAVKSVEHHVNKQSCANQPNPRHKQSSHIHTDGRPAMQQMKPNAAPFRIKYGVGC